MRLTNTQEQDGMKRARKSRLDALHASINPYDYIGSLLHYYQLVERHNRVPSVATRVGDEPPRPRYPRRPRLDSLGNWEHWITGAELAACAKANGYQRGAHRDKDSLRDRNKHVDKVKRDQDAALDRYVL